MNLAQLSPEAREDALSAYAYYEDRREGLGARFREHLDHAIARICEDPTRYPVVNRELRRRLVDRFPYAVYYCLLPDRVYVVAIMHGRQNPERWRQRALPDEEP